MEDSKKKYEAKKRTPEEAVSVVKDGMWIDYGHALSVPRVLDKALAARAEELDEVFVRGYLIYHPIQILAANQRLGREVFVWNSWFMQSQDRRLAREGRAFHIPMRYAELPLLYRDDIERVDVLMFQTGPMDAQGNFNLGPCMAASRAVINKAKYIIVEANERMPFVNGLSDDYINIDEVDAVVPTNEPLDTIPSIEPSENDNKIADRLIKEIVDGATLQLGIGGMPNALGYKIAESDLKNLGIHSEMYVDSMMAMTKSGVVNNRVKPLNRGKSVFSFSLGSQELYDWMDHNQSLLTGPVDYVNSPEIVASIDNFISINNCVEIDLFGQVNAESGGTNQISGTGGQLDFVLGAYHSHGGKSIIAIDSTRKDKEGKLHSRIVPTLAPGATVTDPRTTTHLVATEYGMVNLKGKSLWQRAEALISIAHPDLRDELIEQAEKLHIWRRSNKR